MTLPFRRRHHDDEAWHDRARALMSADLLEPLGVEDQAWLDAHLERCRECASEREAYAVDRSMLRALRDQSPTPPRDLWARTAAAIELEASGRARRRLLDRALGPAGPRRLPLGPLAGVLVAAVVLVVALLPPGRSLVPALTPAATGQVAVASTIPGPTPLAVSPNQVAWIQTTADGRYALVFANVDEVCPPADQGCAQLHGGSPALLGLDSRPNAVMKSPTTNQVAVIGSGTGSDGTIVIVTVPTAQPSAGPGGTPPATKAPISPIPSPAGPTPPALPTESAAGSPLPSSSVAPGSTGQAIIHGVVVVGEPGYSADGHWFAFSARPQDGSRGPDLYAWHVGDESATQLTDDGRTFFSGWFGNQILASGLPGDASNGESPTEAPGDSTVPGSASVSPSTPAQASSGVASPSAGSPSGEASAAPPTEVHPFSFLLDPETRVRTLFAAADVWLPAIDPTGRFVVYWAGTVAPDASGGSTTDHVIAWRPATGRLVVDGWSAPLAGGGAPASPSAAPSQVPDDRASPAASDPSPVASGPTGTAVALTEGPLADFEARFDPKGERLALWAADPDDPTIGHLWLVGLDPAAGAIDPAVQALAAPGVVALRGFSIDAGRLGWVTPPGQNGQPSSVQVLAWTGDDFGQIETIPGGQPQIVR